mmetsp:Transcript_108476/g.317366  ORF Transcript_108476/g.317366 Transcript_108476/m.317366 type:complete len:235 (-) Transcript_108476:233-937(-)
MSFSLSSASARQMQQGPASPKASPMREHRRARDRKRHSRRQRRVQRTQRLCTTTMSTAITKERQAMDANVRHAPARRATGPTDEPARKGSSSRSQGHKNHRSGCRRAVLIGLPAGGLTGQSTTSARMGPTWEYGGNLAVTTTHLITRSFTTAPSGSMTVACTHGAGLSSTASPVMFRWICGRPVILRSIQTVILMLSSVHHFATMGQMGTRSLTMRQGWFSTCSSSTSCPIGGA